MEEGRKMDRVPEHAICECWIEDNTHIKALTPDQAQQFDEDVRTKSVCVES